MKTWHYKPIPVAPNETKVANARMNVQVEIAERLNRAKIECASGGDTRPSGGMDIVLGWRGARKLLRLLQQRRIGA